jgi:hypothetical protein
MSTEEFFSPRPDLIFQAIPRPSSVGEFIEFATGREALKLVGDLRLSQAVSRALYDGSVMWWADPNKAIQVWVTHGIHI